MKSLEDLEDMLERGMLVWENEIVQACENRMGQKIIREVKRITPVETGNLRRRWFCRVDKEKGQLVIWICNDAEYAAAINNGHRIVRAKKTVGYKKGRYMLEKGISTYQMNYLRQDLENMLTKLGKAIQ